MFEFQNIIPNTHLVVELLDLVLKPYAHAVSWNFFQQIFGSIMGTNIAPILANFSSYAQKT